MSEGLESQWLQGVAPEIATRVDEALARGATMDAIKLLRGALACGLAEAKERAIWREEELRRAGRLLPEPGAEQQIEASLARLPADTEVLAVEAAWDGDSRGWCVVLALVVRREDGWASCRLADVRDPGGDMRIVHGTAPPWPEAARATELGSALAARLGVPFHFASPEAPNMKDVPWGDRHVGRRLA